MTTNNSTLGHIVLTCGCGMSDRAVRKVAVAVDGTKRVAAVVEGIDGRKYGRQGRAVVKVDLGRGLWEVKTLLVEEHGGMWHALEEWSGYSVPMAIVSHK